MQSPRRQVGGQSMTEFLVAMAFLAPMVVMLPTMANLLSVQTEAHKASRYVAWERTAYATADLKSPEDMADDIEQRFLVNPESSFGSAGASTFVPPWRDFGNPDLSVIDLDEPVVIDRDAIRSATDDYQNASAWMADRGGRSDPANAVQLDTLQTSRLSIPINSEISVLQGTRALNFWFHEHAPERGPEVPMDPIAKTERFYVASSSALVADGWAPANEQMFRDRVSGMNVSAQRFQRWWEGGLRQAAGVFEELEDHLYVDPVYAESFNMTDSRQSTVLPTNLKPYSGP